MENICKKKYDFSCLFYRLTNSHLVGHHFLCLGDTLFIEFFVAFFHLRIVILFHTFSPCFVVFCGMCCFWFTSILYIFVL